MDSFSQYLQTLPPQMQQQVLQKVLEKQATEQAGFPFWMKQQQVQQQMNEENAQEKDAFTMAMEQLKAGLKEKDAREADYRKLQQNPAYQAFTDYADQQQAHTRMLVDGLKTTGEIFKALPKSPKYLSELSSEQNLTTDEQYALKGVKSLIEKRLKELDTYEKDPNYADMLWETSGKGTRKMTDMGKYIIPTLNREKDYLNSINGALKGVDGWNPKIDRGSYFQAVSDGLRYYNSAHNNPLIQQSPEGQAKAPGVSSPKELGDTVKYIDDFVNSHSNWVYVPEINMNIPSKRYEELKNMSGYILDGKKLTTTPAGGQAPAWDFLEHLPEGKKKELAAALGGSTPVQNKEVAAESAIQNLMIGLQLRPDMQQKILQALPVYAGQKGLDLGKIINNAKGKLNYSAVAVDSAAMRHGVDSPVEPVEPTENKDNLAELERMGGKKGKQDSSSNPNSYLSRTTKDIEALAGAEALAAGAYQGVKKLGWPALKMAGQGFKKLPGWGKAIGIGTVALPALYELWKQRKSSQPDQQQPTGE